MCKARIRISVLMLLAVILAYAIPANARGNKVIPQVADGPGYHTKFDLINISSRETIANFKLRFFRQTGASWSLTVKIGSGIFTGSDFTLNLSPRQTVRVETMGSSAQDTAGYVIIEDNEPKNTGYSQDFVLGISVFYEVYSGGKVVDTVSVPVTDPTGLGTFPVEIDSSKSLLTGFAVVNLAGVANKVTLQLYAADSTPGQSVDFTIDAGKQRAEYLNQFLFPGLGSFKGMAEFRCTGAVGILALLQTPAADGSIRYSTLVPTDREALRRNTRAYLRQSTSSTSPFMPMDVDAMVADYFRTSDADENFSWDFGFEYNGTNITSRFLKPYNGAVIAPLGIMSDYSQFDNISLPYLKSLSYSENTIDMSDGSPNWRTSFAFAIRTDLGNYAKIRIDTINDVTYADQPGVTYKDLVLEIYVYR